MVRARPFAGPPGPGGGPLGTRDAEARVGVPECRVPFVRRLYVQGPEATKESAEEIFRTLYPDCRFVWVHLAPQRDMYLRFHVVGVIDLWRRRPEPPSVDGPYPEEQTDHLPRRNGEGTAETRWTTVSSVSKWQNARLNTEPESDKRAPDHNERIPDPA
jgi:hypothetical protein